MKKLVVYIIIVAVLFAISSSFFVTGFLSYSISENERIEKLYEKYDNPQLYQKMLDSMTVEDCEDVTSNYPIEVRETCIDILLPSFDQIP